MGRPILNSFSLLLIVAISCYLGRCDRVFCPSYCRCSATTIVCQMSNNIGKIPSMLPNMRYISTFAVMKTNLMKIETAQFVKFEDLETLILNKNKIATISKDAFQGLMYLKELNLAKNQIRYLPDDIFQPLMYLKELRLDNNQLMMLPSSIESLLYLNKVKIIGNPLNCDCHLKYFSQILLRIEDKTSPSQCDKPQNLRGSQVTKLKMDQFRCNGSMDMNKEMMHMSMIHAPESKTTTISEMVMFHCTASGYPEPKISWKVPENNWNLIELWNRNKTIKITDVRDYHEGLYTCIIEQIGMQEKRIEKTARLDVIEFQRPQIVAGPTDQIIQEGDNAMFSCKATGKPKPKLVWLRNRITRSMITTNEKYIVRKRQGILIVKNVTEQDSGMYECYASNRVGSLQVSGNIMVQPRMQTAESDRLSMQLTKYNNQSHYSLNETIDSETIVKRAIERARKKVEEAIKKTAERLRNPQRRRSSSDIQSLFRQPNQAALELATAAQIYEAALEEVTTILRQHQIQFNFSETQNGGQSDDILKFDQLFVISQLAGCQSKVGQDDLLTCAEQLCFHKQYRSIDGTCNNLNHPKWGAALSPFRRLLAPQYENGVNTPIGWNHDKLYFGYPKPSSRLASRELLYSSTTTKDERNSAMLMQWGQFIDHDLDFTPVDASTSRFSDGLACNETCVNDSPCFPILIPPNDPRIHKSCIGFTRSIATCGSGSSSILLGKPHFREQINQITAYIDASNVYGSEAVHQDQLREKHYDEGELRVGVPTPSGKRMMPFNVRGQIDCQVNQAENFVACFKAGDHRSNENLGLLSMHTLWMREHNRIVRELRFLNPHWTGDKLYHEGRKIVGAQLQHITFYHWLPHVLGKKGAMKLGSYRSYDDKLDATISNAFATAAFRFGHTLIQGFQYRLNENFTEISEGHLPLHKSFFAPDTLLKAGGIDPIIRGLFASAGKHVTPEQPLNQELTEKLFKLAHEVALDLGALNIQRGRDHGLPGYNEWRKLCGLSSASTFDDLQQEIPSAELREKLRRVYGHPGNIDLFAGGVLESVVSEDAKVGPTFACIISDQFKRLRDGDRFWFENPEVFTLTQQAQLRGTSLARIICDNADNITKVQEDVFMRASSMKDYISCKNIPKLNLISWKECMGSRPTLADEQVPINRFKRGTNTHSENICRTVDSCSSNMKKNLNKRIQQLEYELREFKQKITEL